MNCFDRAQEGGANPSTIHIWGGRMLVFASLMCSTVALLYSTDILHRCIEI